MIERLRIMIISFVAIGIIGIISAVVMYVPYTYVTTTATLPEEIAEFYDEKDFKEFVDEELIKSYKYNEDNSVEIKATQSELDEIGDIIKSNIEEYCAQVVEENDKIYGIKIDFDYENCGITTDLQSTDEEIESLEEILGWGGYLYAEWTDSNDDRIVIHYFTDGNSEVDYTSTKFFNLLG